MPFSKGAVFLVENIVRIDAKAQVLIQFIGSEEIDQIVGFAGGRARRHPVLFGNGKPARAYSCFLIEEAETKGAHQLVGRNGGQRRIRRYSSSPRKWLPARLGKHPARVIARFQFQAPEKGLGMFTYW